MKKINKMLNRDLYGFKIDLKLKITALLLIVSIFEISANTAPESYDNVLDIKEEQAQNQITGTVVDELNQPLSGVNVVAKGTKNGVSTGFDGKFSITVPSGTTTLVFSYIGYKDKEVALDTKTNIIVKMVSLSSNLNEVVVVAYGTQKKKNMTSAVSVVKAENLSLSSSASALHGLQGKAAGLQIVQNSAQPGGGIDIQIRGAGTLNSSSQPLIVVDGFPLDDRPFNQPGGGNRYDGGTQGVLNSFNPNDIESISVVKDAASTAIYGARGANGIILITTKKGAEGDLKVEYSGSFSKQSYNDSYEVLNLPEFMQLRNDAAKELWDFTNRVYPYSSKTLEEANAAPVGGVAFKRYYSDEQIRNAGQGTDWLSLVTRDGTIQQHNLSFRGGTKSTKYFMSANTFSHDGVVENSGFNRNSFRISLDQKINDYVSVGVNLALSRIKNQNTPLGDRPWENSGIIRSAIQEGPHILAMDEFGNYPINPDFPVAPNPYSLLTITDEGITDRALTNFYAEAKPFAGLTARFQGGFDLGYASRNTYLPRTTLYGDFPKGKASIASDKKNDGSYDFTLNYSKTLLEDHNFSLLVGHSKQTYITETSSLGASNFVTDSFLWNNIGSGVDSKVLSSDKSQKKFIAYFSRLTYSYKDRYFLNSSIRREGYSEFAENNKYGLFPSVSLGWDVASYSFMDQFKNQISQFKLRFGYGTTGNVSTSRFSAAFEAHNGYLSPNEDPLTAVSPLRLENKDLKWETTTEKNIGLDFEILNRRVSGSVEVYNRVISDLIQEKLINSYNPSNNNNDPAKVWANVGAIQSNGVEVTLNTVNIDATDFKWKSILTYSKYKTNWKERAPDWKPAVYESYNDPLRARYTRLSDGIMQAGEVVPAQPDLFPGQIKIKDINGFQRDGAGNPAVDGNGVFLRTGAPDGKIDEADTVLLGSTDPDFVAGFSNMLVYKKFALNFHFNGMFGRKIVDQTDLTYGVSAEGVATQGHNAVRSALDRWTPNNPSTTRPGSNYGYSQYGAGDFFLQNASFVRLQSVSLTYKLPTKWAGKYLNSADIRCEAQNLFVITDYNGIDPETDAYTAAYPNVKTYTLGIDLKF